MPTNDILFVLVIYRCTVAESLSYQTLVAPNAYASSHLFIYDNSPYTQTTDIPHVAYIHDTANGGLGRAYNSAASFAVSHNYRWLLLMDQDTSFPPHALPAYLQAAASLTAQLLSCPTPPSTAPAESCVGSDSSRP
ncbi:MAG: glycosyltransferase, partial [Bacteroidaceae bacterium]|nr:glycosyltransferase [Bacteroidaceae bacterium]